MKKLYSIDLLRTFACLLIVNFHNYYIYPNKLKALSFGGDLGNNIFFMISGFMLYESISKIRWADFGKWVYRRYAKILPITLMMEIITFFNFYETVNISNIFEAFIYPTLYWFSGAIVIFYPLLFIVVKILNIKQKYLLILTLISFSPFINQSIAERYVTGFVSMMIGTMIKENISNYDGNTIIKKMSEIPLLIWMIVYVSLKLIYAKVTNLNNNITHTFCAISIILLASSLLIKAYQNDIKIEEITKKSKLWCLFVEEISKSTLIIYLSQQYINFKFVEYNHFEYPDVFILYYGVFIMLVIFLNIINKVLDRMVGVKR